MHDRFSFDGDARHRGSRRSHGVARSVRDLILDGVDTSTVVGRLSVLYRSVALLCGLALGVPFSIGAIRWLVVHYASNANEKVVFDNVLAAAPALALALIARYRAPLARTVARLRAWVESFGTIRRR